MRPIDADALKETICNNVYPVADAFNSRDYGMFWTGGIEKAIDEQPTIGGWIPCSERLPEREGRYLVTNSAWGSWTVDVCAWIGHWHSDDKPIAWMPLPKPYGEREGE